MLVLELVIGMPLLLTGLLVRRRDLRELRPPGDPWYGRGFR